MIALILPFPNIALASTAARLEAGSPTHAAQPKGCLPRLVPDVQHGIAVKTTRPVPAATQSPASAMSSCPHDDRGGAWPMRAHRPTSLDPIWEANR